MTTKINGETPSTKTLATSPPSSKPAFSSAAVLIALMNVMTQNQKLQIDLTKIGVKEADISFKSGMKASINRAIGTYIQGAFSIGSGLVSVGGAAYAANQLKNAANPPNAANAPIGPNGRQNVEITRDFSGNRGIELRDFSGDRGIELRELRGSREVNGMEIRPDRGGPGGPGNDAGQVQANTTKANDLKTAQSNADTTLQYTRGIAEILRGYDK